MSARSRALSALLALALAACSEQDLTIPQSPLLRHLERRSGRIAYLAGDGNIWIVDQSGGGTVQVTGDAEVGESSERLRYYQFPAWSPDGSALAFLGVEGTSDGLDLGGLFVASAAGGGARKLYASPEHFPQAFSWSPDGRWIAFSTSGASGINVVLRLVQAPGEPAAEARDLDAGNALAWSWMDGAILVHATRASLDRAADRLSLLHIDDDEVIEEGLPLEPGAFLVPAVLPDGRRILAGMLRDSGTDLVLADRSGTVTATLASSEGGLSFVPSPNGRRVACGLAAGDTGDRVRLAVLEVRDGAQPDTRPVASVEEPDLAGFVWSPDGSRIAYFVPSTQGAGDEATLLLTLKVLDVARRSARTLRTFAPTTQFVGMLQQFEHFAQVTRIWSPDGKHLLYCAQDEQGAGLWVAAAAGVIEPRRIAEGYVASWSWK